jgi:hypothetical protein
MTLTPTPLQVELLSNANNAPVLRIPMRQYPGVLVQGDTLNSWGSLVKQALRMLQETPNLDEAVETLEELRKLLEARIVIYEEALQYYGMVLPYTK